MHGVRRTAANAPRRVAQGVNSRVVNARLINHIQTSAYSTPSVSAARPAVTPLRSQFDTLDNSRSLHQSARLRQEAKAKEEAKTEEPAKKAEESTEEKKTEGEEAGEKKEGEKEGEEGKKDDAKKEAPPPPPPHGDKSPWQVFTETLQTEFKQSKEWNEGTKQLADSAHEFTESEGVRRAREAYEKSTGTVAKVGGKVLKTTAGAVGKTAAYAWETPVVKGVRVVANATGNVVDKATKPIRETEAFKSVKNVIDDGSSSKYGGWVEKEERRKAREAREAAMGRVEVPVENPDAGTNVTLHKDAAWKESWREFRDSNKVMQGLFSMKNVYEESENPLISTARSISDRIAGFFAENETAQVIKKFKEMDPTFSMEPFLREMREYILPEVLDAYVKGDAATLKLWLSDAQFSVYDALSKQYTTAGLKSDGRILDIRHVDILNARMLEPGDIPVFIVTCRTQEVHVYRNAKSGELAAGMEDKVQLVTYAIGVTRLPEEVNNPETRGWRFIELQKSGRDYI